MFLSRSIRPIALRSSRAFISAVHEASKLNVDPIQNFEQEHARLLRVVQNRINERAKLLSEVYALLKSFWTMVLINFM